MRVILSQTYILYALLEPQGEFDTLAEARRAAKSLDTRYVYIERCGRVCWKKFSGTVRFYL